MEVGPTKDIVLALLDFLVDPLLPSIAKSSSVDKVNSQQELVAKQVHAVVLLYNYYHRKLHPNLEFLEFEPFCKMAVDLKPSLRPYLNLMQELECTSKDDLDVNLSLTEKAINDCCRICKLLDASVNYPLVEDWPISRVAVFLVDSKIENCYLFHSSITQGVWSMIEKDVDESTRGSETVAKMKSGNKKKKAPKGSPNKNQSANEASLLQIAWLAVKETCGISQDDLRILEDCTVYSISKEKTAVRFYIMQCTETDSGRNLVPINDIIQSMKGPLVMKESDCWLTTSAVEYFHLLPFADKLLDWLSRQGYQVEKEDTNGMSFHAAEPSPNTSQSSQKIRNDEKEQENSLQCLEAVKVEKCSSSHLEMKQPPNILVYKRNRHRKKCNTLILGVETSNSTVDSPKQQDEIQSVTGSSMNMDIDESLITCSFSEGRSDVFACKDVDDQKVMILAEEKDQTALIEAAEVIDTLPNLDEQSVQQPTVASKEASVSKLLQRRDMLSQQHHSITDDLALCESCIQTILSAGKEKFSIKVDASIEGCTGICERSATTSEDINCRCLNSKFAQGVKRKRLSEASLFVHSQELDDICTENGWILPTYNVSPSEGDICNNPCEARNSAAVKTLVKVREMTDGS